MLGAEDGCPPSVSARATEYRHPSVGFLAPLLPGVDGRGWPWRDHRQVVNGVLRRLRTGAPWRDLPERCGPWQTVSHASPAGSGTGPGPGCWSRSRSAMTRWAWWSGRCRSTPRSTVHTSTRPEPAKKGALAADELEGPPHQALGQELGRSCGGLTTKVHLAVDGRGLPLAVVVTPDNVNDSTMFDTVLQAVRVPRLPVRRPRRRPETVIASASPHSSSGSANSDHLPDRT